MGRTSTRSPAAGTRGTIRRRPRKTLRAKGPKADSHKRPHEKSADEGRQRLQKVLAAAGVASRRECEKLVVEGRVEVDRQIITRLGTTVDPRCQEIRVDGTVLAKPRLVYYMVHKPPGVVSTARDPAGRPRVIDMVPATAGRVFTVGRLDIVSEGLILLTNDGELAHRLAHPRYGIEKLYQVQVAGRTDQDVITALLQGVRLAEGMVRARRVRVRRQLKQSTVLDIVLTEGKNREIRRLLARLGHKVQRLRRVGIGPLSLSTLPSGQTRPLSREEIRKLKEAVADGSTAKATPRKRRSKKRA